MAGGRRRAHERSGTWPMGSGRRRAALRSVVLVRVVLMTSVKATGVAFVSQLAKLAKLCKELSGGKVGGKAAHCH